MDSAISALTAVTGNGAATDEFGVNAGGVTEKTTLAKIRAFAGPLEATTVTASGTITSTRGNNTEFLNVTSATTGYIYGDIRNTSGRFVYGVEGSVGGNLMEGSSAYDAVIRSQGGISFTGENSDVLNMRLSSTGLSVAGAINATQHLRLASPTTKATAYTLTAADSSLIFNGGASITLTLEAASTYPGRILYVKNIAAFVVVSSASNVVPLVGGAAGTAILAAVAGRYAMLQSDGTNWIIMSGVN